MDYEQKYKEALERAKGVIEQNPLMEYLKKGIEYIFPELKESENERIRKGIIRNLEYLANRAEGFVKDDLKEKIAWLEKQGEKPQGKSALEAIKEEKVDNANKVEPKDYSSIDPHFFKTTDKVEPKFHKGDWIVHHGTENIYQVVAVIDNQYQLKYGDNYTTQYCEDVDRCARLWDISDAKAGDILIDKSNSREYPFIFKETKPSDVKTDVLNPLTVLGYCGIGGAGFTKGSGWGDTANCTYYPATKEQRDQLKKAMANAGYAFDFDKKELKKLSQSEVTKMSDQEEIAEIPFGAKDSELQEATYYIPKGFHAEINDDKVVIYGNPQDLFKIKEAITKVLPNVEFDIDEITMLPKEKVTLTGEDLEVFNKMLAMLDEIEDVQNVYHNVEL